MCAKPGSSPDVLGTTEEGCCRRWEGRWVPFWDAWGIKAKCAPLPGETQSPGRPEGHRSSAREAGLTSRAGLRLPRDLPGTRQQVTSLRLCSRSKVGFL